VAAWLLAGWRETGFGPAIAPRSALDDCRFPDFPHAFAHVLVDGIMKAATSVTDAGRE